MSKVLYSKPILNAKIELESDCVSELTNLILHANVTNGTIVDKDHFTIKLPNENDVIGKPNNGYP